MAESRDVYGMPRTDGETKRLELQEDLFRPFTERLLDAAGIAEAMRVLDLGSGAGGVLLPVAERVGPSGEVVGIELDGALAATAQRRAAERGLANVKVVVGDAIDADVGDAYDALVGRLVLMHIPRREDVFRRLVSLVKPGGAVAFLESNLASPWMSYPRSGTLDQLQRVRAAAMQKAGPVEFYMGVRVRELFISAGLPAPILATEAFIGGGPDWPGFQWIATLMRSVLPMFTRMGVTEAAEVDVDTLEDRLRAELGTHGLVLLHPHVAAWSRKPN